MRIVTSIYPAFEDREGHPNLFRMLLSPGMARAMGMAHEILLAIHSWRKSCLKPLDSSTSRNKWLQELAETASFMKLRIEPLSAQIQMPSPLENPYTVIVCRVEFWRNKRELGSVDFQINESGQVYAGGWQDVISEPLIRQGT